MLWHILRPGLFILYKYTQYLYAYNIAFYLWWIRFDWVSCVLYLTAYPLRLRLPPLTLPIFRIASLSLCHRPKCVHFRFSWFSLFVLLVWHFILFLLLFSSTHQYWFYPFYFQLADSQSQNKQCPLHIPRFFIRPLPFYRSTVCAFLSVGIKAHFIWSLIDLLKSIFYLFGFREFCPSAKPKWDLIIVWFSSQWNGTQNYERSCTQFDEYFRTLISFQVAHIFHEYLSRQKFPQPSSQFHKKMNIITNFDLNWCWGNFLFK